MYNKKYCYHSCQNAPSSIARRIYFRNQITTDWAHSTRRRAASWMIQSFDVALPQRMCHSLLIGPLWGKKVFHCRISLENTEGVSFMWTLSGRPKMQMYRCISRGWPSHGTSLSLSCLRWREQGLRFSSTLRLILALKNCWPVPLNHPQHPKWPPVANERWLQFSDSWIWASLWLLWLRTAVPVLDPAFKMISRLCLRLLETRASVYKIQLLAGELTWRGSENTEKGWEVQVSSTFQSFH